jgi:hypothetical protein
MPAVRLQRIGEDWAKGHARLPAGMTPDEIVMRREIQ